MTTEQEDRERHLVRIVRLAAWVAAGPPLRRGSYVSNAGVPWGRIIELRAALDEAGIDWRANK